MRGKETRIEQLLEGILEELRKEGELSFLVTLASQGRITVPVPVREELGLREGDRLIVFIRKMGAD